MRDGWWLTGWATALVVLLLWPALGVGYVLSYDMVWVPDLSVGRDALGVSTALPRAVPSDLVVGLLDEVVPGVVLQKLVLVVPLVAGAVGAARLVPQVPLAARSAVVTLWIWNPFVVERLGIGHWPVLVGYAVLPWLLLATREARARDRLPPRLGVLLLLGSLSPSAGLASVVVVLAFGAKRGWLLLRLAVLALGVNLPWIVSGVLHRGAATSDGRGAGVFALASPGSVPEPLVALGLGGIWNLEVVPGSRAGPLAWAWLLALALMVLIGLRPWWRATPARERAGLLGCWGAGWMLAVLPWALPGPMAWFVEHVPGGGLLRDSTRLLGLCAPLLVVLVAHGTARVLDRLAPVARVGAAAALVLFPVAVLPDASAGAGGHLVATDYPAEYDELRDRVGDAGGAAVLVLPFESYRAPGWNGGRKVLDPVPRYLEAEALVSDTLVVSGREIPGEDPRAARAATALDLSDPRDRAQELAGLGVGLVLVDHEASGEVPEVPGERLHEGEHFTATRLSGVESPRVPTAWWWAMGTAWLLYGVAVISPIVGARPTGE